MSKKFDKFQKEFEKIFGKNPKDEDDNLELPDGVPPELADLLKRMGQLPGVTLSGGDVSGKGRSVLEDLLKHKINKGIEGINSTTKEDALEETLTSYSRAIHKFGDAAKHLGCDKTEIHEKIADIMRKDAKVKAACTACFHAGMAMGARDASCIFTGALGVKFISLIHICTGAVTASLDNVRNMIFDVSNVAKDYPTFRPVQKEIDRISEWKSPFAKKPVDNGADDD